MQEYEFPNVDWGRLYRFRSEKTGDIMKEQDLDAMILTCWDNIRYTTDFKVNMYPETFNDSYAAIVAVEGDSYIYCPFRGQISEKPIEELPWVKEVIGLPTWIPGVVVSPMWAKLFKRKLYERKLTKVGVDYLPFQTYEELKREVPEVSFKSIFNELLEARAVKHEEEIKLLRYNASILDAAAKAGLDMVREGVSERQIVAAMVGKMFELGVEGLSHYPISSGEDRSLGRFFALNRYLIRGDIVNFDIGFYGKGGYATDMARTGIVGKPKNQILESYRTLYEAYFEGINAIRPGMKASEIDQTIRKTIIEAGYPDTPFANGHGIGLRVQELPTIDKAEEMVQDMELETGMVFCLEPRTSVANQSMSLEDMILVTETGYELLTKTEYWPSVM